MIRSIENFPEMPHRIYRMEKQHPGTGKSHHFPYFFTVFRFVAMNGTFLTKGFFFPKWTTFQSLVCISFHLTAIRTKRVSLSVFEPAVNANHFGYRIFFSTIHYFILFYLFYFPFFDIPQTAFYIWIIHTFQKLHVLFYLLFVGAVHFPELVIND